jgi:DNA-binding response OmpR family regulator
LVGKEGPELVGCPFVEVVPGMVLAALIGWGQEEDRLRAAEAGFDRRLVKPVDPVEIEKLLAELSPTHRPERSL